MDSACGPYMHLAPRDRLPLRYLWDDTRASKDFSGNAAWVLREADALSLRAQMVVCVGLYEWVVCRFEGLHADPVPLQVAEAAWCATVDPRYMTFFELTREAWLGPVRGPLWCAITWLRPAVGEGDQRLAEVADALQYLTRLALHVLPEPARFEAWLKTILARLAALHPPLPEDPFDDLFDQHIGRRRGPLIGRPVLDPSRPYAPETARAWVIELLAGADPLRNPFLASREQMQRAGFAGPPL